MKIYKKNLLSIDKSIKIYEGEHDRNYFGHWFTVQGVRKKSSTLFNLLSAKWRVCMTWKHVPTLCPKAKPQVSEIEKW